MQQRRTSKRSAKKSALKDSVRGERGYIARSVWHVAGQLLLSDSTLSAAWRIRWQHARAPLRAAFEKESIQQQQNHGADDGHNPAGYVVTTSKDAANPRTYKRAGYTEQNRYDATTGIFSRHQQFCDRANDKTDKQSPNN